MSPLTDANLCQQHAHDKHLKAMWAQKVAALEREQEEAERVERVRRQFLDQPGERTDE